MKITEGTMVLFKAFCYAMVALFSPVVALLVTAADANTADWPSPLKFTAAFGLGFVAMFTTLRAYFDGSNSRWEDNQNGSFRVPPTPPQPEVKTQ